MPAARDIVDFHGVVEVIPFQDSPIFRYPSAPSTTARPWCLRMRLLSIRDPGSISPGGNERLTRIVPTTGGRSLTPASHLRFPWRDHDSHPASVAHFMLDSGQA